MNEENVEQVDATDMTAEIHETLPIVHLENSEQPISFCGALKIPVSIDSLFLSLTVYQ